MSKTQNVTHSPPARFAPTEGLGLLEDLMVNRSLKVLEILIFSKSFKGRSTL